MLRALQRMSCISSYGIRLECFKLNFKLIHEEIGYVHNLISIAQASTNKKGFLCNFFQVRNGKIIVHM